MLDTQWHVGMNGRTGLIYPSLFELLDRRGLADDEWWRMFDDIREMEVAALNAMRED